MPPIHEHTLAKVNAWVDVGVKPLVDALNQFDEIITLESCEGVDDRPATVIFIIADAPIHGCDRATGGILGEYIDRLMIMVGRVANADRLDPDFDGMPNFKISLTWDPMSFSPMAAVETPKPRVKHTSAILAEVARQQKLNR